MHPDSSKPSAKLYRSDSSKISVLHDSGTELAICESAKM
jgi:hypothetical protein